MYRDRAFQDRGADTPDGADETYDWGGIEILLYVCEYFMNLLVSRRLVCCADRDKTGASLGSTHDNDLIHMGSHVLHRIAWYRRRPGY